MYPELSKFESLLFRYLSAQLKLKRLADVSETHPLTSGDLGQKGRVTITQVYEQHPKVSRLQINPSYQLACWDLTHAKSRRLQELVIESIEAWDKPSVDDLRVLTPVLELARGVDFSSHSQLYFSSIVYCFPICRVS